MQLIAKTYSPQEVEDKWYKFWEENNFFHASPTPNKKPYTIVIPPPNITGILTMGHVLNNTLQDVFIRWKRMQGFEACWVPGTDHAGIATQNVVERDLIKKGIYRRALGREEFVKKIWEWKNEYGSTIITQLRKLGSSFDWRREKFTLDPNLSIAVQEVFVKLYEKGLIYKGKYIVNWCPKDHTAISDDEVNFTESLGHLWHIKYKIQNADEYISVATTRPETMLGDSAVAVNPKDERYKNLIGKNVLLPLSNRIIPIIADDFVDAEFGTGAVKITPAHDMNDYQTGLRHNLPQLIVMDTSGKMNENVPKKYQGLDRYECRKEVLRDLEKLSLLEKMEDHTHSVGHCYRCDTVIEPYLSDQWFVKMKPLAEPALQVVKDGKIKFHPDRWTKVYEHWMENIRDWCISRQLWWGHRIPAWYCVGDSACKIECKNAIVSIEKPKSCPHCGSTNLVQDEDVLDTWFSSWLWPFSVFEGPNKKEDLEYFYPTNTLVTGPDIIFFWVARMIMAGLEFQKEIPFRDVYFTSIIRDLDGRKMSKSLGNSPNPLDVISTYGADALRFTVIYLAPIGQDVLYSNEKCEIGRNFANKIWNAARFLLMNRENLDGASLSSTSQNHNLDFIDTWISSRFSSTVKDITKALDEFNLNEAVKILYSFFWHDFCDWYVEFTKHRIYLSDDINYKTTLVDRAISIFDDSLKLLHPFMPFITEEIWQNLSERKKNETITLQDWPKWNESEIKTQIENEMIYLQNVIGAIRSIRSEMNIAPSIKLNVSMRVSDEKRILLFEQNNSILKKLTNVEEFIIGKDITKPQASASAIIMGDEIFVPLKGLIDLDVERNRLEKEILRLENQLHGVMAKLNNEKFTSSAPKDILEKELSKKENFSSSIEKLKISLLELGN